MKNHRLVVVLGMHRSGTSAITKGLEVMGVNLGASLMPGDKSNVKGYFEDLEINRLNVELLQATGHEWTTLAPVEKEKLKGLLEGDLGKRATGLLQGRVSGSTIFGFKDPRICRLLPFWKSIFAGLELQVSYVLMMRDPDSIAASLFARNAIPRIKSLYMWAMHMIPAFMDTASCDRVVVDYNDLVTQPRETITQLAVSLKLSKNIDHDALQVFATEFVDSGLRHHRGFNGESQESTPRVITKLISVFEAVTSDELDINSSSFSSKLRRIQSDLQDRSGLMGYIDTLDSIIVNQHRKLQATEARVEELSAARDQAGESLRRLDNNLAAAEESIARLQQALEERERALDQAGESLRLLDNNLAAAEQSIARLQQALEERERALEAKSQAAMRSAGTITELREAIARKNDRIAEVKGQLATSQAELLAKSRYTEVLVSDTDKLMSELETIKTSRFWRYSQISWSLWKWTEKWSAKQRFQLIPVNDLERARPGDYSWTATGNDPQFRLVPVSGKITRGWVHIRTLIEDEPANRSAWLYLDCGEGFSEERAVAIPLLVRGKVSQVVKLPANLRSLRWDPKQQRGRFRQYPIVLERKNWLTARLQMIRRVVATLIRAPSEMKRTESLTWKALFGNLQCAYEAAGRILSARQ